MNSGTSSGTDSSHPAVVGPSKRHSESSEEEPPRKHMQEPTTSRQADVQDPTTSYPAESELQEPTTPGQAESLMLDHAYGYHTESAKDASGRNLLHWAAERGDIDSVRELLVRGLDTRLRDKGGRTPLHLALENRKKAVAELLVGDDSTNEVKDSCGATPLHQAALLGYDSIVAKLLLGGVQPHVKDRCGVYPLQCALQGKGCDIEEMILAVCAWRSVTIDWTEMNLYPDLLEHCIRLFAECFAEMERMKNTQSLHSGVNHDVMRLPLSRISLHLENQDLRKVLLSDRLTEDFPHFGDLMAFKVMMAEERRVLSAQCRECFCALPRKLPLLPQECTDVILRFLSERNKRNFVSAFKFKP